MKLIKNKALFVTMAGLAISAATCQAQLSFNFASTPGATIQFNGTASTFQFNTSTLNGYAGSQWSIGSEAGGVGSALGLFGLVNNSPFAYGPISQTIVGSFTIQDATVTGPLGGLVINDGSGHDLTGNVNWVQVETVNYAGGINASLSVNVNSLAYSGANPDLLTMVANGPGSMDLTFQFSPGKMLSQLTSGTGSYTTSYSGSRSVPTSVPEPASITFFLLGMGALVCSWRLRQDKQA
jgi:hypothetical protein